jgi:hypothetical protein
MLTTKLPTQLWRLAITFLHPQFIINRVPVLNKYFEHVVWGQHADAWLWREVQLENIVRYRTWYDYRPAVGTLLMLACLRDAPLVHVQTMVAAGIMLDTHIDHAWTALMIAVDMSRLDIAETLLENGANVWYADSAGHCAMSRALRMGDDEMIDLLLDHMVKQRLATQGHRR